MAADRRGVRRRTVLAAALAAVLPGCGAWSPVPPYAGSAPQDASLVVVARSWHTEIGLAAADIHGPLATLLPAFPDARQLVFGWGERDYYMAAHPGSGDMLGAILPSDAVMLVIPIAASPAGTFPGAEIVSLGVSRPGLDRLGVYLWGYLAKGPDGRAVPLGPGPYPGSVFYASGTSYDLTRTCNTFTAGGLHAAGLPVDAGGVVLARQVTDQLRGLGSDARASQSAAGHGRQDAPSPTPPTGRQPEAE